MQLKAPRGTYDILPDNSYKWQYIEKVMQETAETFGYQEIRTPIFEQTELFERGVGETTDIVTKEMYTFYDKGNRSLTLRPEGTASCVRALIEHSLYNGVMPVKWHYTGPMFRYDRPQTGRYRQFHQFGIEAFGSKSPYLDVEVISLLVQIFINLGITGYELHLNSVGCPECREIYRQKLIDYITPIKNRLCRDCLSRYDQNPLRVLDCKNENCQKAITGHPVLHEYLCAECRENYAKVQNALDDNDISYIHDDNLVRGLDYYTNTAFEIHLPEIGAQSAIGGGGRYDGLVKECGGPDLPGIGFAIGIERLLLAAEKFGNVDLRDFQKGIDVFITVMRDDFEKHAIKLLNRLRKAEIPAEKDYTARSARAQMKYADKIGARAVILIGEDEIKNEYLTVRNMQTKAQIQVAEKDIIKSLNNILFRD